MRPGVASTRPAGAGPGAAPVPEPALRPVEAYFPRRYSARRARVYIDHGAGGAAIVIRDPRGRERRIPAGPGGASRVVLEPAGALPGFYGVRSSIALVADSGQVLARLPMVYWRPESVGDGSVTLAGRLPDDAAAFAAATGLPVTEDHQVKASGSTEHLDPAERARRADRAERAAARQLGVVTFQMALPAWFLAARALLALAWAGPWVVLTFEIVLGGTKASHGLAAGTYQALALICAAAALAQPLLAGALMARAWWLDRGSGRPLRAPAAALAPHPARPVTRRFLRIASLRLLPADLVVTDADGAERWLPRSGPVAVTALARITVRGRPDRLELRTAEGRPRAVLPWHDWFGGPGGEQELAGFANAAGLPVTGAEGKHLPEDEETVWPYRRPWWSASRRPVSSYPQWTGLPGEASLVLAVIAGISTAIDAASFAPAAVMAIAAALLAAGAWFARRLARRSLDRTVHPGEAT